jgi:hypothetical protein
VHSAHALGARVLYDLASVSVSETRSNHKLLVSKLDRTLNEGGSIQAPFHWAADMIGAENRRH